MRSSSHSSATVRKTQYPAGPSSQSTSHVSRLLFNPFSIISQGPWIRKAQLFYFQNTGYILRRHFMYHLILLLMPLPSHALPEACADIQELAPAAVTVFPCKRGGLHKRLLHLPAVCLNERCKFKRNLHEFFYTLFVSRTLRLLKKSHILQWN